MRDGFDLSLGIQPFVFDRTMDTLVASGNDPDVYTRAHELLRSYRRTHRFAVVVLDNAWDGSPGVDMIQHTIQENMISSGWHRERFEVVVIDPELEAWIWQDSQHVMAAFRFTQHPSLRQWLGEQGLWDTDAAKPADPKRAVEVTLRASRLPRSSAIYRQITSRISCLKDYAEIMKNPNGNFDEAKRFFLDVAYDAWRIFNDLRRDNRFNVFREKRQPSTKSRSPVKKDRQGNVVDVSLGVVFPVLYALGEFVRKNDDGHWSFTLPDDFDLEDVIEQANSTFRQGPNDPAKMGKDSTCYVSVKSPVKMYKKMHDRYNPQNRLVEA